MIHILFEFNALKLLLKMGFEVKTLNNCLLKNKALLLFHAFESNLKPIDYRRRHDQKLN